MQVNKLAVQENMLRAIEQGELYSLEGWTTPELEDLEFAAHLQSKSKAHTVVMAELVKRDSPV